MGARGHNAKFSEQANVDKWPIPSGLAFYAGFTHASHKNEFDSAQRSKIANGLLHKRCNFSTHHSVERKRMPKTEGERDKLSAIMKANATRNVSRGSERLQLHHVLFLLFIMLKPFYFRSSGTAQISDLVFLLSCVAWISSRRGNLVLTDGNQYFLLFTVCVYVINAVYSAIYPVSISQYRASDNYLVNTMYYTYNLLVVLQFSDNIRNDAFLKSLLSVSVANIGIQAIIHMLGAGGLYFGVRYFGTFNDPNQFAFFLFMSFLIVYVLLNYFNDTSQKQYYMSLIILFMVVTYLVSASASTGVLLGLVAFLFSLIPALLHNKKTPISIAFRIIFAITILFVAYFVINYFSGNSFDENYLFRRVSEKIGKAESGGIMALIKERGLDKVFRYPEYLLFGSGEGYYDRFIGSELEIHSTIPSILFTYGIIPSLILLKWVRFKLRKIHYAIVPVYIGLLFESLTLLNQRQPMFWMIILLGSLEIEQRKGKIGGIMIRL